MKSSYLLAQLDLPTTIGPVLVNKNTENRTIITEIILANVTGGPLTYQLCHDRLGTTWTVATATFGWNVSLAANAREVVYQANRDAGLLLEHGGSIGGLGSLSGILCTVYGYTADRGRLQVEEAI